MRALTPPERLIVAADFRPNTTVGNGPISSVESQVLSLAYRLKGTGVYLKMNSALRACGYGLIEKVHSYGLRVCADLKLFDIKETLSIDGVLLGGAKPELVTAVCFASIIPMQVLKKTISEVLPDTEVLGVTVLTCLSDADMDMMFQSTVDAGVSRLAHIGESAGIDGFVCSAMEAPLIRSVVKRPMTINTPAIRPIWAIVHGDDQNPERIMTPVKARRAGADRIVVGRPIVNAPNPYDAVMRTIEEIESV